MPPTSGGLPSRLGLDAPSYAGGCGVRSGIHRQWEEGRNPPIKQNAKLSTLKIPFSRVGGDRSLHVNRGSSTATKACGAPSPQMRRILPAASRPPSGQTLRGIHQWLWCEAAAQSGAAVSSFVVSSFDGPLHRSAPAK
eukprot:scaffold224913_cov36-Tisochrysis_lutea.AAC.2